MSVFFGLNISGERFSLFQLKKKLFKKKIALKSSQKKQADFNEKCLILKHTF